MGERSILEGLKAEIERIKNLADCEPSTYIAAHLDCSADWISAAAAEIERLRTRAEKAEAALKAARDFVARDLQSTLECVCTLDKTTLEPIESTIDPEEAEHVASIRAVLAQIDQVLGDAK